MEPRQAIRLLELHADGTMMATLTWQHTVAIHIENENDTNEQNNKAARVVKNNDQINQTPKDGGPATSLLLKSSIIADDVRRLHCYN